jgi:hypothetical protein
MVYGWLTWRTGGATRFLLFSEIIEHMIFLVCGRDYGMNMKRCLRGVGLAGGVVLSAFAGSGAAHADGYNSALRQARELMRGSGPALSAEMQAAAFKACAIKAGPLYQDSRGKPLAANDFNAIRVASQPGGTILVDVEPKRGDADTPQTRCTVAGKTVQSASLVDGGKSYDETNPPPGRQVDPKCAYGVINLSTGKVFGCN